MSSISVDSVPRDWGWGWGVLEWTSEQITTALIRLDQGVVGTILLDLEALNQG